jgi:hypothetical protein
VLVYEREMAAAFAGAVQKEHQWPPFPVRWFVIFWQMQKIFVADRFGNPGLKFEFPLQVEWGFVRGGCST